MDDSNLVEEEELSVLAESLANTRKAMLTWLEAARSTGEVSGDVGSMRQLERAARHIASAVHELKPGSDDAGQGADEDRPGVSGQIAEEDGLPPLRAGDKGEDADGRESVAGLRGTSDAISIPELLDFLSRLQKSGLIDVEAESESFRLQLSEGLIVYAQGNNPPEGLRLGEVLITIGAMSRQEMECLVEEESAKGDPLGAVLLRKGVITEEQLRQALSLQTRHIFTRLFSAEKARFAFHEGATIIPGEDIRLSVTHLLLESARSLDEGGTTLEDWLAVPLSGSWGE